MNNNHAALDLSEYKNLNKWSDFIAEHYGLAATSIFASGMDYTLDIINANMVELSLLFNGETLNQLTFSEILNIFLLNFINITIMI